MEPKDELLTAAEVAELLDVTPRSVERMAKQGRLAGFRTPSGQLRFRKSVVLAGMERLKRRRRGKRPKK